MLTDKEIIQILRETEALLTGHFLLTSGLHSKNYVQCALLTQNPELSEKLCSQLAVKVSEFEPEVVIGPALGGVIVAYELARALKTPGIFAERKDGQMQLRRGFKIKPGQRVLVAEDVITTGGSAKEVVEIVGEMGGQVVAVASLIDRSGGRAEFGVPFRPLISLEIPTWKEEDCPHCKAGGQPVKPGSRA
jgi:orotate phosphoribosyltransferase